MRKKLLKNRSVRVKMTLMLIIIMTSVIAATYNEDGTLNTYTITIDGKNTSTYTATYDKEGKVTTIATTTTVTEIKNTKLSALPSTGGIGTTIFYVVGAILMVGAAVLLITKRRAEN